MDQGGREIPECLVGSFRKSALTIVFGLQMTRMLKLGFPMQEKRWEVGVGQSRQDGQGWTPCVGLALGSILLLAGSTATVNSGMLLLFLYSLGLGLPFLAISVIVTYSLGIVRRINRSLGVLSIISAWVLIAMGLLVFTGQLQRQRLAGRSGPSSPAQAAPARAASERRFAWERTVRRAMKKYVALSLLVTLMLWGVYDGTGRKGNQSAGNGGSPTPNPTNAKVGLETGNLAPDFELRRWTARPSSSPASAGRRSS